MRIPMSIQSGYAPPPIGTVNGSLFPGPGHTYMTMPPHVTSTSLGGTPIQKHSVPHNAHAHGAYPHLPFSSSPFDSLNPPPTKMHQGQPTNIGNLEYSDVHLDWLSSLAEASHHTNPTILVSPADGSYSAFTPSTVPEEAATFFAASAAVDTCMTGSHSDIRPLPVHVPRDASGLASPFNSIGGHTSFTPIFSSTPSTFEFSPSPGLTQHSPAGVKLEGEQGLDLVGLFSRPPSGNFATLQPYSKEVPQPPSGVNLLTIPLATQLTFTDHSHPNEFGIQNTVLSFSSCQAPYATGRKEVRFPNQKKVNVVEDMCKWFPEQSDFGRLLKRICATKWYHNGELEPTFGNGSDELTFGLALGFEIGQSILLGFIGSEGNCLYCGHTSPKKDRIVAHVREHLGLRPFVCTNEGCPCKELPVYVYFRSLLLGSRFLMNLQAAFLFESRSSY